MRVLFFTLTFIISFSNASAEKIKLNAFNNSLEECVEDIPTEFILSLNVNNTINCSFDIGTITISKDNELSDSYNITISDMFPTDIDGLAYVPITSQIAYIPTGMKIDHTIINSNQSVELSYPLIPSKTEHLSFDQLGENNYCTMQSLTQYNDDNEPNFIISQENALGAPFVRITFSPIQYNPVTKTTRLFTHVDFSLILVEQSGVCRMNEPCNINKQGDQEFILNEGEFVQSYAILTTSDLSNSIKHLLVELN